MESIELQINNLIKEFSTAPYLFVGSGFSRRYVELEDWENLLRLFCNQLKDYEYYRSNNNGDMPAIANAIAQDFSEMIWESEDNYCKDFLIRNKSKLNYKSSALKIAISEYISQYGLSKVSKQYFHEIELLKKVNIEGIITTNWDELLKELFPDFTVVVGQDELINSNPFGIGEIFKIHGCLTKPESLVLTNEDYDNFNNRNAYLAAKLVTYFVEHPVIFIGYSMTDPNITQLLTSILNCLGKSHIDKISNNFIFVQRSSENETITKSVKVLDGVQIPITILSLNDFSKIYKPLTEIKRRLPVRLLRYFKEQLIEFIHSNDPKEKVAVVDIDSSTNLNDIEFAIGYGVHDKLGKTGYERIQIGEIIEDVLFNTHSYNAKSMVENCIPDINGNVPIFKYYNQLDDFDIKLLKKSAKKAFEKQDIEYYTSNQSYQKQFDREWKDKDVRNLFNLADYDKAMRLIPFYKFTDEDEVTDLGEYLKTHYYNYFVNGQPIQNKPNSNYRKLVCLYDLLKFNTEW